MAVGRHHQLQPGAHPSAAITVTLGTADITQPGTGHNVTVRLGHVTGFGGGAVRE